jgi:hypothetical protein
MHGATIKIIVILFISGRDSCPDERSNGLRAAELHTYLSVFLRAYKIVSFIYLNSATYFTSVSSTSCRDLLFYFTSVSSTSCRDLLFYFTSVSSTSLRDLLFYFTSVSSTSCRDLLFYFISVSSTSCRDLLFYCTVCPEKCVIMYRMNTATSYSSYTMSFTSPRRKGTAIINYLQTNTKPDKYAGSPSPGTQFVSVTRPMS